MIPNYQKLMRHVLECVSGQEKHTKEIASELAKKLSLTPEEIAEKVQSGNHNKFYTRVYWAKTYLKQAGLLKSSRRGFFEASEEGIKALKSSEEINNDFLMRFSQFKEFVERSKDNKRNNFTEEVDKETIVSDSTPDEILRNSYNSINRTLAAELLSLILINSAEFFENLIIDLLIAMGYGGTSENAARAIGRSGDDGVDGVIDQDPLGVDQIYIQAKRYKAGNSVGSSDIRDFYGSLSLKKANKGIFFTTSHFTPSAIQTAKDLSHRIVLIDGDSLSKLMIKYKIGCRDEEVLYIKKIDEDYFSSE